MKIMKDNINTELKFRGSIDDIREIIRKLQYEERSEQGDIKSKVEEFLKKAFGTADEKELDDTRAFFTQLDIKDILDDFTDYVLGAAWSELVEKNKKRRLARMANRDARRELY